MIFQDLAGVAHSEFDPSIFPEPSLEDFQQEQCKYSIMPKYPKMTQLASIVGVEQLPLTKVQAAITETRADWYSLAVELNVDYGTRKVRGTTMSEVVVSLKLFILRQ